MDTIDFSYAIAAFAVSAFLKGITGLGFSTICLGLLAIAVDPKVSIALVLVPSLASNVLVMREAGRFREALNRFWPLLAGALPGLLLGLALLARIEADQVRTVLGLVMLAYAGWALLGEAGTASPRRVDRGLERALSAPVGFLTGVINGTTGSQVMPVLPYLLALRLPKDLFVQTINISFTASSVIMLAGLARLDILGAETLAVGALGIVPVALGIWLGGKIRRRLSEAAFRRSTLVLLVPLGLALIAR